MFVGFGWCPCLVLSSCSFVFCCVSGSGQVDTLSLLWSSCSLFRNAALRCTIRVVVYERKYVVVVCRDFVYIVFRRWFSLFVRTLPKSCRCSFRVVVSLSWFFGARTFCLVGLRMTWHYKFFEFVWNSSL